MTQTPPTQKDDNPLAPPTSAGRALRRLLWVLAGTVAIFIYAYGWTVTEIDLETPQEERRLTNVTVALRELLSPRLFQQERSLSTYATSFVMAEDCSAVTAPAQPSLTGPEPAVAIEPACASSGDEITVRLVNAIGSADARIRWTPPPGEDEEESSSRPREILETGREEAVLNSNGSFIGTIEVPRIRGGGGEIHTVEVLVAVPAGPIEFSETATLVIDRMAQTIFMALVATTVAIPIAAVLSFLAARNLMQQVRLSVGTVLLAFLALMVGVYFGGRVLGPLGEMGVMIGRGDLGGAFGALFAFIVPVGVVLGTSLPLGWLNRTGGNGSPDAGMDRMRATLNSVVLTIAAVFVIGAVGGLGLLGGEQISALGERLRPAEGGGLTAALAILVRALGNLLTLLGRLVELFIRPLSSVLVGFTLAAIAGNLLGGVLRRLPPVADHVSGAVLGALSGALLLVGMAVLGLNASLLGLLPLLVASIMGGMVFRQVVIRGLRAVGQTAAYTWLLSRRQGARSVRWAIFSAGGLLSGIYVFERLSLSRTLVDGTLPAQTPVVMFGTALPFTEYMMYAMLIGGVLAGISGALTGVSESFPLGTTFYNVSRAVLNVVRSIEPLIMGLVFVVWVGIGPFAGVLALTLHSIAALGKLYSEQIENIDPGPLEALRSTGANQLQTIVYAVVPQIIPPYIAFTMYRWDINVRMSTIIGFVGGGGIGLLLQQQINLLRYRDAGVAVLAIAVVVSVLDYASALIRERVT